MSNANEKPPEQSQAETLALFARLGEQSLARQEVFIKDVGLNVVLHELDWDGRDKLDRLLDASNDGPTQLKVLALTMHAHSGRPVIPTVEGPDGGIEIQPAALKVLKNIPPKRIEGLFRVACRLNGLGRYVEGVDKQGN